MPTIYVLSPVNKLKVPIGNLDTRYRTATFYISEARYFKEAEAVGIDLNVFNRKAIQYCEFIQFNLWDNRKYRITRTDFTQNCWRYPPKETETAPRSSFTPKLMISEAKLKELSRRAKEQEDQSILLEALK